MRLFKIPAAAFCCFIEIPYTTPTQPPGNAMYDKIVKVEVDKCDVTEDWENLSYV